MQDVRALVFDVFGTVVDWRSSIIAEGERLGRAKGLSVDWPAFADAWRAGYPPALRRVRSGELPWTGLDDLHRMRLDELIPQFGLDSLNEAERAELNRAWRRLDPWPDAVAGLTRLKRRYIIGTLSNGSVGLLVDMAKRAGLPWDVVLSGELVRSYKTDPAVYRSAPAFLGLEPHQVMLVAAHRQDLLAASAEGLRTGFVPRPLEFGPGNSPDLTPDPSFDVVAADFEDLARQLGA